MGGGRADKHKRDTRPQRDHCREKLPPLDWGNTGVSLGLLASTDSEEGSRGGGARVWEEAVPPNWRWSDSKGSKQAEESPSCPLIANLPVGERNGEPAGTLVRGFSPSSTARQSPEGRVRVERKQANECPAPMIVIIYQDYYPQNALSTFCMPTLDIHSHTQSNLVGFILPPAFYT